jgi:CRP-like cAMP-binding protein
MSSCEYVVDDSTKRLIELTHSQERNEDDIDEIISLVNEKAPKLFEGLAEQNKEHMAKTLVLKAYANNDIVFRQGDIPDAYYTVIRGAVSIYALNSSTIEEHDQSDCDRT